MTNARDKANIPSLNFSSTGIDDNATSTAITIDSSGDVGINNTAPNLNSFNKALTLSGTNNAGYELAKGSTLHGALALQGDNRVQLINFQSADITFNTTSSASERMRITSAGKVGIGTSAPTSNLSIQTSSGEATADLKTTASDTGVNFHLNGNKTSNGGIGSIIFSNNGDSVAMIRSNRASANDASDMLFYTQATGGSNSEHMRISSAGDVGIGTTNAFAKLVVEGDNNSNVAVVNAIGTSPNYIFDVRDDGTSKFRVDGSGNVGIGETAPFANVHVKVSDSGVTSLNSAASGLFIESANSTGMTIASGTTNVGRLVFADSGNNLISYVQYDHSNNAMSFQTNGSERMRIDSSGNVGIKNTTMASFSSMPGTDLVVGGGTTHSGITIYSGTSSGSNIGFADGASGDARNQGIIQYHHNGDYMRFFTSAAERMRIDSSGNVGIGTTSTSSDAVNIKVADTRVTSGRCLDVHHSKTDTTFSGIVARFQSARNTTNGTYEFIRCAISGQSNKFIVTDGGTIQAVNTTVASISDERIKQDIVDAKSQWDDIKALKFKNFKKKQAVRDDGDNALKELGVIAQDVESAGMNGLIEMANPDISNIKSDSSFGTLWTEDDEEVINGTETVGEVKEIKEKVKTVKYSMIWMKSVKALQEAMERIEKLEAEVTALKNQP